MNAPREVIGYTTAELIDLMLSNGIHCSLDRFKAVATAIQQKALDVPVVRVTVPTVAIPDEHMWDLSA
jgi:hypothetical protein